MQSQLDALSASRQIGPNWWAGQNSEELPAWAVAPHRAVLTEQFQDWGPRRSSIQCNERHWEMQEQEGQMRIYSQRDIIEAQGIVHLEKYILVYFAISTCCCVFGLGVEIIRIFLFSYVHGRVALLWPSWSQLQPHHFPWLMTGLKWCASHMNKPLRTTFPSPPPPTAGEMVGVHAALEHPPAWVSKWPWWADLPDDLHWLSSIIPNLILLNPLAFGYCYISAA